MITKKNRVSKESFSRTYAFLDSSTLISVEVITVHYPVKVAKLGMSIQML